MPQLQQEKKKAQPRQKQQRQPGIEAEMKPLPKSDVRESPRDPKLRGQVAVISGGDRRIGRAVAVLFAAEGADVAVLYLDEKKDAKETVKMVEETGRRAIAIAGDIGDEAFCRRAIQRVIKEFGRLDILINNAAEQH